jgi:hypothetical protein
MRPDPVLRLKERRFFKGGRYTLHRTLYRTPHRIPYTIHRTSYTVHRTHRTLYTGHRTPDTVYRIPCTLHWTPYTLHWTPDTVNVHHNTRVTSLLESKWKTLYTSMMAWLEGVYYRFFQIEISSPIELKHLEETSTQRKWCGIKLWIFSSFFFFSIDTYWIFS